MAQMPHRQLCPDRNGAVLLTVRDVADMLQVCPRTVRRMIKRGDLPAIRLARQYRVRRPDLEALMTGFKV